MTHDEALARVLAVVEAELDEDEVLGLYQFSWALGDAKDELTETEIHAICSEAYEQVMRGHQLKLVWSTWPLGDLSRAQEAGAETRLDFLLDEDAPKGHPLLALVPRSAIG